MILFLVTALALALGCTAAVVPETKESKLAYATNDLAFDLLKSFDNENNVFISPFSISTALALLYLGAEGTTAQTMRDVLKYDKYGLTAEEINHGFQSFLSRFNGNSADYQLSTYNNVLVQENFHILDAYREALKLYYSAKTESVNFETEGEKIKERINNEVEVATKGKIKDFLQQPLDAATKLFLLNAIYFLGNWENPFKPDQTYDKIFYNNGIHEKRIQMMSRDGRYRYSFVQELNSTMLVLPYKGDNSASMIILLPLSKTGISQLEQLITQSSLVNALENSRISRAIIQVPKFNLTYSTDLVQPLSRLGLEELFGNGANLSGIAEQANLKVSSVLHKAVIEVNERGSEAASATGIEIVPYSQPPVISVDHPFLFFIRDNQSGMILFSGRVNEL